ncbi:hypothetical protein JCM10450v2_006077 [Rhodotorula kratochvilovae]
MPGPVAATSTASEPPALRLSTDSWLIVLNRRELSYFDLKRFSRVCKRFHSLEQDSHLDSRLFRRGYPADFPRWGPRDHPLKKGSHVAFHPVLHLTSLSRPDLDEADITVFSRSGDDNDDRCYKPLDLPVAAEYATSPPCAKLVFLAGTAPVIADARGVRVRSVIEAVTSMWVSPAPAEFKFQIMMERGMGMGALEGDVDEAREEQLADELDDLTTWDTLGDSTFWAGMKSAKCVADGVVELAPNDFD